MEKREKRALLVLRSDVFLASIRTVLDHARRFLPCLVAVLICMRLYGSLLLSLTPLASPFPVPRLPLRHKGATASARPLDRPPGRSCLQPSILDQPGDPARVCLP
jgi:hypothetical protein